MSLGENQRRRREDERRGDLLRARFFRSRRRFRCFRLFLVPFPSRCAARYSPNRFLWFKGPFALNDGGLELLSRFFEGAAFIKRPSKISMRLCVVVLTQLERGLEFGNRVLQLPAPVQHKSEIVMRVGGSVALGYRLLQ